MKSAGAVACAKAAQQAIEALEIWAKALPEAERVSVKRRLQAEQKWSALYLWDRVCEETPPP